MKILPDPHLEATRRQAVALLRGAPDREGHGKVEVRRWRDRNGSITYDVNLWGENGGYSSPQTSDLRVAVLASELLALANGSTLLRCRECDADEEARS